MAQKKSRSFSPEFRAAAVREVVEKSRPASEVARDCGVTAQTIRNWIKESRAAGGESEPELSLSERARLKELERRVRELEEENLFLGKSVAFFAKKHL